MLRVMTCNIRTSSANDGDDHWTRRNDFCLQVIRDQQADLIGFQETQADQYADLRAGLPGYSWHAMADEPHSLHPVDALCYRTDRFELVSAGGYWLSETPHVAGSSSWDSACVRLANWVRLQDRESDSELRFVNTHLDHVSQPAREGQARVIADDAGAYDDVYPQILTGDMNCIGTNGALDVLRGGGWQDTYEAVHGAANPDTFHGFKGDDHPGSGKIDWIFTRGSVRATASEVVREAREGRYMSDHDFLWADLQVGR